MPKLPKILKELVEVEYSSDTLAKLQAADLIYKIIPLSKIEFEERKKLKGEAIIE